MCTVEGRILHQGVFNLSDGWRAGARQDKTDEMTSGESSNSCRNGWHVLCHSQRLQNLVHRGTPKSIRRAVFCITSSFKAYFMVPVMVLQ